MNESFYQRCFFFGRLNTNRQTNFSYVVHFIHIYITRVYFYIKTWNDVKQKFYYHNSRVYCRHQILLSIQTVGVSINATKIWTHVNSNVPSKLNRTAYVFMNEKKLNNAIIFTNYRMFFSLQNLSFIFNLEMFFSQFSQRRFSRRFWTGDFSRDISITPRKFAKPIHIYCLIVQLWNKNEPKK